MSDQTEKAVEIFKKGGVVIFPTDTAFGIGCRIDNEKAIKRIFGIRKRPENKPLLALVSSIEMAQKYLLPIPQKVKKEIIDKYWPGKVTIILKCDVNRIPSVARGGGNTLGLRFPDKPELLRIINAVGVPIVAPSANFSAELAPFKFEELNPALVKLVDYVFDGKAGLEKDVSTIIDCTVKPWKIIRKGAVKIQKTENKKQKIILLIDTADNKKNIIGLKINSKKFLKVEDVNSNRTQMILPMIDRLLKENEIKLRDICAIEVNIGPGSYTGLRVGLAVANALSFALKIPINGKKVGEIILPIYS
jgi:L-threonylcarbamoyladenylate synthase